MDTFLIIHVWLQFLCIYPKVSLSSKGGFCYNNETRKQECCDNFVRINNVCTECKNGTYSYNKTDKCEACRENMYGYKCLEMCRCDDISRCDPVVGCVLLTAVATTQIQTIRSTDAAVADTTNEKSSLKSGKSEAHKSYKLVIYMGVAAGLILILVMVHCIRRHRPFESKNNIVDRGNDEEMEIYDVDTSHYDDIDDSHIHVQVTRH